MIEWDYGYVRWRGQMTRHRDMLVPLMYIGNPLVMRIVNRLIDVDVYPHTRYVRISEERVDVEIFPQGLDLTRRPGPFTVRDYIYRWCSCPCRDQRCDGTGSFIVIHRSWPLIELLVGQEVS